MRPSDAGVTDAGVLQDTDCLHIDRPGSLIKLRTTIGGIKSLPPSYHNHQAGIEKDEITNEFPIITEGINNTGTGGTDDRGKFKVGHGNVWFYDETDMDSTSLHLIPESTDWINPNSDTTYITCADSLTDTWVIITDATLIDGIRYVPYFIVIKRAGSTGLHTQPEELKAHGEIESIHQRFALADRYAVESGFTDLAIDDTLNITTLTGSVVWSVTSRLELPAITAATRQFKVPRTGSATSAVNPVIENKKCDEGAGWIDLTPGSYVINWLFRGVEHQDHLYTLLSKSFVDLAAAQAYNTIGVLPQLISSHAVKIAKIIVQYDTVVELSNIETIDNTKW